MILTRIIQISGQYANRRLAYGLNHYYLSALASMAEKVKQKYSEKFMQNSAKG
jgi:hypothetical protein